jgi:hypothetical protein
MKELVRKILTNHKQSSLEGLHMITGGDIEELRLAISELIDEGWLKESVLKNGYGSIVVYKRKETKQLELWKN